MKYKTVLFFLISAVCFSASASVEVLENNPRRLVLRWEMDDFDTVSVQDSTGISTLLSFAEDNVVTGDPGEVLLPGYSMNVGVPVKGNVRVSVSPEEVYTQKLANPLKKRNGVSDSLDFSAGWVSEPIYKHLREYRAAQVVVRPFQSYEDKEIRILKRAVITFSFPSSEHSGHRWEPSSDYERMVRKLLVNFSTAQGWFGTDRVLSKTSSESAFPLFGQKVYRFSIGDGSRDLNETSTKKNGVVKIRGERIQSLFGESVKFSTVALYASVKGELDQTVPTEGSIPAGVFEIPTMRFDFDGDGNVDSEDYILAYVSEASDWEYNSYVQKFTFGTNRYDDYRTFWLTVKENGESSQMASFNEPDGEGVYTQYFENNVYLREPLILAHNSREGGINWAWKKFEKSDSDTIIDLNLPGLEKEYSGHVLFNRSYSSYNTGISASLGETDLCSDCRDSWSTINDWESDQLRIEFFDNTVDQKGFYELSGIHLRYQRRLEIDSEVQKLEVFSSNSADTVEYHLSKSGNDLAFIFRVPPDESEISLVDTVRNPAGGEYSWVDEGRRGIRYMILKETEIVDVSDSLEAVHYSNENPYIVRNLRNTANQTDYLIVTHSDFLSAAMELARHKKEFRFSSPKIVLIDDVYNQFSGGNTDPSALRNFFAYVYRNWNRGDELSYVVLFGSGHYDYKHLNTNSPNFLPTAQIGGECTEDYFVFLKPGASYESQDEGYYYIGRLPVKSESEGYSIVEKIVELEEPQVAEYDSWRNRVVFVADDDQQGEKYDEINRSSIPHHVSSERVVEKVEQQRPSLDIRKVYLFDYEWNEQYAKPGATRALINEINSGAAAVNWFGHGIDYQWSDEHLFTKEDVVGLYNRNRYPLVTSFSCSVGKFDKPDEVCLSALLVKQPRAGAIATISSTREVIASNNERLAVAFYSALFDSTDNASVGMALNYAKVNYENHNNRPYVLLGDPSIIMADISREVDIALTDDNGIAQDSLKALQQVTVRGSIKKEGQKDDQFGGSDAFVNVTLFNPSDTSRRKDGGTYSDPTYVIPGNPVFSTKIPVVNGSFEQSVLLPMSVTFNDPGVKLIAYAWDDSLIGTGYRTGIVFDGTDTNIVDSVGPRISIRPVYNSEKMDQAGLFVTNRITAHLPLKCEIRISDESGINVVGTGPDEGLRMEVEGALSKRSINHLFQFSEGDHRKGVATLTFEENTLKEGIHNLVISAQDLLGNITKTSVTLEVLDQYQIKLDHVLNIPNPVRMGRKTRFYYYHSNSTQSLDVDVTIRIYTLSGRLLKVIRNPRNGESWVPRDERGNLLSPNVYLYQITAEAPAFNKSAKSGIKKLVVHPPR
ncbi:MAG: type IX secretion system sortase PorU [Chitinispirillaceae bacterium]